MSDAEFRPPIESGLTDSEEAHMLATTVLTANEWRGVEQLTNALFEMEPLAKRGNLGQTVADRIVELGLAERGPASERYSSIGMTVGYRLNELGWKFADRGRWPRRQP